MAKRPSMMNLGPSFIVVYVQGDIAFLTACTAQHVMSLIKELSTGTSCLYLGFRVPVPALLHSPLMLGAICMMRLMACICLCFLLHFAV